jgi:2-dehydro-3-deoxy-D-arabinonate dehydratase
MKLAKVLLPDQTRAVVSVDTDNKIVQPLDLNQVEHIRRMSDILAAPDPIGLSQFLIAPNTSPIAMEHVKFLSPVDQQEVWAAGVTYKRSMVARMEESEHGESHYDQVYKAPRPELFFKATPSRVVAHNEHVRIRSDSNWSVPEPELVLCVTPDLRVTGYTIGNDMSSRDIEGENPLYLPQAKCYNQSCALGPWIRLAEKNDKKELFEIYMKIERQQKIVYEGNTSAGEMVRSFEELAGWLGYEMSFPDGALLFTGTGLIPPDDFTLQRFDTITISIKEIGELVNVVVQGEGRT